MGIKLLIGSSMHFGATKIPENGTTILHALLCSFRERSSM